MLKTLISIILFSILNLTAKCQQQSFELNLLKSFAEVIQKQQFYNELKSSVKGAQIIEDPVLGETKIQFVSDTQALSPIQKKSLQKFKSLSLKKQIEIIKMPDMKLFPLKDTVYLIDNKLLLSNGSQVKSAPQTFITVREVYKNRDETKIFINKIVLRGNEIYLSISFKELERGFDYGFKFANGKFDFISFTRALEKESFE